MCSVVPSPLLTYRIVLCLSVRFVDHPRGAASLRAVLGVCCCPLWFAFRISPVNDAEQEPGAGAAGWEGGGCPLSPVEAAVTIDTMS